MLSVFIHTTNRSFRNLITHEDGALLDIWNEYFNTNFLGDVTTCVNCSLSSRSQYFFYQCIFYNLTNSGIYISDSSYNFLDSDCMFYNCYSPGIGGGMHIDNSNSAIHRRFCGNFCKGQTDGDGAQFVYSYAVYNNSLIEGTVFDCGRNYGGNTIRFKSGTQLIHSVNDSFNHAIWDSCFYTQSGTSINVNYTTFYGNSNTEYNDMFQIDIKGIFYSSNIINNSKSSTFINNGNGGTTTFYHCSFMQNAYSSFSATTTILDNCFIDSYYGYTSTNSAETSFVNPLSHLSTAFCYAAIPITPDNQKRSESTEEPKSHKRNGKLLMFLGCSYT
ncbi:hypothetical protein TVAG_269930 [Trichomonas vaginalis G3]|uniref:Right handed beta helix domain-containing protein n=1 Tax=Trichomonas vaginalis (strain ATCC PRA-98 / G3) TaxID=412133 RepID=A2F985_TRIV3|nr:pectin lyase-like family [Trichomonas vaginalis G3]EAX98508.1 hypothetical protein TVAG_269930 [Trichomonas vaginalis G3]KAI5529341.1 pectin lyase-like family [Trichomonas vaginalis G3]|eukprot:XP_001311438.1 hypothetical protein [Trichomonas vaginalis G3]